MDSCTEPARERSSDAAEWRWLLNEVRPLAPYQATALLCTLASSAVGLLGPLVLKWLIDGVLPSRRWQALVAATGLMFVVFAIRNSLSSVGDYIRALGVQRLVFRLRLRLFKRLQRLPANFYERQGLGDLVQRVERDVNLVGDLGSDVAASAARMIVETAMTVSVLIVLDWQLSLVVVPLLPLFAYVRHRHYARLQRAAESARDSMGRQSDFITDALSGAVQIQLLGAEARFARGYARLGIDRLEKHIMQRKQELIFTLLSSYIISVGSALVVGYGGLRVMMGGLTAGGFVAFYAYVATIFFPMSTAADMYSRLNRVRASIRRLIELEKFPGVSEALETSDPITSIPSILSYANVSFNYEGHTLTLRGVVLTIRSGERVAVVGESGCGKTSLLKLIPRLYDATEGRVLLDGRDIRSMPLSCLRRAVSFVPQDAVVFCGTLRDNLLHGCPTATSEDIASAARLAGLTDIVERLPAGWETSLGTMGSGLSGGEKQRLAIARALLQQRPILILDEATSALDPVAEAGLLTRLYEWCAGRIVIVVSHRLAVACWTDRVIVLRQGQVVEDGSHQSLYRPGTQYYDLWQRENGREKRTERVEFGLALAESKQ